MVCMVQNHERYTSEGGPAIKQKIDDSVMSRYSTLLSSYVRGMLLAAHV
jgi:hypothetical protein